MDIKAMVSHVNINDILKSVDRGKIGLKMLWLSLFAFICWLYLDIQKIMIWFRCEVSLNCVKNKILRKNILYHMHLLFLLPPSNKTTANDCISGHVINSLTVGTPFSLEISLTTSTIMAWINWYIFTKVWDVITDPCHTTAVLLNRRWSQSGDEQLHLI